VPKTTQKKQHASTKHADADPQQCRKKPPMPRMQ